MLHLDLELQCVLFSINSGSDICLMEIYDGEKSYKFKSPLKCRSKVVQPINETISLSIPYTGTIKKNLRLFFYTEEHKIGVATLNLAFYIENNVSTVLDKIAINNKFDNQAYLEVSLSWTESPSIDAQNRLPSPSKNLMKRSQNKNTQLGNTTNNTQESHTKQESLTISKKESILTSQPKNSFLNNQQITANKTLKSSGNTNIITTKISNDKEQKISSPKSSGIKIMNSLDSIEESPIILSQTQEKPTIRRGEKFDDTDSRDTILETNQLQLLNNFQEQELKLNQIKNDNTQLQSKNKELQSQLDNITQMMEQQECKMLQIILEYKAKLSQMAQENQNLSYQQKKNTLKIEGLQKELEIHKSIIELSEQRQQELENEIHQYTEKLKFEKQIMADIVNNSIEQGHHSYIEEMEKSLKNAYIQSQSKN